MDLMLNSDQEQIVAAAVAFLGAELPVARLRALQTPDAQSEWTALAEGGWLGISLDEVHGGSGLTLSEEALVTREFGRNLLPLAVPITALAARVAAQAGNADLARALAHGRYRVAFASGNTVYDTNGASFVLTSTGSHAMLLSADSLISRQSIDPGSSLATVDLATLPVVATAHYPGFDAELRMLCASMLVGMAEAMRDLAVAYACERQQFGKPIGSFQAIKHYCADMAVACEASLAQLKVAAVSLAVDLPDSGFQATAARIVAQDAALRCARTAIQIHGAMGITAECLPHFYLKRAHLLGYLGGSQAQLKDALLAMEH